MPKHEQPAAEHLLALKDELVTRWKQLPSEQQATMLLVLLKDVMETELGGWTLSATFSLYVERADPERRIIQFPSVTRAKLARLDFPNDALAQITDDDLTAIAGQM